MDTREIRARLRARLDKQAELYALHAPVQLAIDPAECRALMAEYCPASLEPIRACLAERTPTHVVLYLREVAELLDGYQADDDQDD